LLALILPQMAFQIDFLKDPIKVTKGGSGVGGSGRSKEGGVGVCVWSVRNSFSVGIQNPDAGIFELLSVCVFLLLSSLLLLRMTWHTKAKRSLFWSLGS